MTLIGFTCVYNEEEYVPFVMPYVEALGYDKFIVFDNGSTDRTVELLKEYPFVEIRHYETNGEFDDNAKRDIQWSAFIECKKLSALDIVVMTWTDFDEVLLWHGDVNIKKQLETDYIWRGYNCFFKNMINLIPPAYITDSRTPMMNIFKLGTMVHTITGMRGCVWVGGMKPTMLVVNDFADADFYPGNHYAFLRPEFGKVIKNYDDTCRMYGFHMKFIDREILRRKTISYCERGKNAYVDALPNFDKMYDRHVGLSFPLENYFLEDFYHSKLSTTGTEYEGALPK